MKPSKLILDKAVRPSASEVGTAENSEAEELFEKHLFAWKELVENRSYLKRFLEANAISAFSVEEVYRLEKILGKALVLHGEAEFIGDTRYFESFTVVLPTEKENFEQRYKKSYAHSYLLRSTRSKSFYISFGLLRDHSTPENHRHRVSMFYLDDGDVKRSLDNFNNRGFWIDGFDETCIAIFRSLLCALDGVSDKTVSARKQSFLKKVLLVLYQEGVGKLSFDMIRNDFETCFRMVHGDTLEQFDPNLLDMVVKQRFDSFTKNPKLVLEEDHLRPIVDARHTAAVFTTPKGNPQSDFFTAILAKSVDNPYGYKEILMYRNKEDLLLDILRSQFALNYLGKIYFSASYLSDNRNNPKKSTLNLLRNDDGSPSAFEYTGIFQILYPDLVNYLKLNFN